MEIAGEILRQVFALGRPVRVAEPAQIHRDDVEIAVKKGRDVIEGVPGSIDAVEHDEWPLPCRAPIEIVDPSAFLRRNEAVLVGCGRGRALRVDADADREPLGEGDPRHQHSR
jgi:hypothetical protein